ncbi:MAG: hypothetical protein EBT93_11185, partial [Alphaproteobacteria bacterium]|nr:hypothetical protein [Alphaproteobacteria bacterium]
MKTFKELTAEDRTISKTLLHEAIPITGSIVSGTYADENIKNYAHGMFQSVYDYPYLSSSANHIFDITVGYTPGTSTDELYTKKRNIYNQMAQVLVGYDDDGNVAKFDLEGNVSNNGAKPINDAYFLNFARLLTKDEIKKGTFNLKLGVTGSSTYVRDDF